MSADESRKESEKHCNNITCRSSGQVLLSKRSSSTILYIACFDPCKKENRSVSNNIQLVRRCVGAAGDACVEPTTRGQSSSPMVDKTEYVAVKNHLCKA